MDTDVALADAAQKGIGERMHRRIGIRVTCKARMVRNGNAAQNDPIAGCKSVDVVALADANVEAVLKALAREALVGGAQVFGSGQLDVCPFTWNDGYPDSGPFGNRSIVGKVSEAGGSSGRSTVFSTKVPLPPRALYLTLSMSYDSGGENR